MDDADAGAPPAPSGRFATTRWSLVAAAADTDEASRRAALEELCEGYWYPVYAFVRSRAANQEDAQDLTQAFFARALEKGTLAKADRSRGRFRTFLRTAIANFLLDEQAKANAAKRGGGAPTLSIDFEAGESRYLLEPSHEMTPERVYDRRWAMALIERTLATLEEEWRDSGRSEAFDALKETLPGAAETDVYAAAAAKLGISEAAAKQAAYRLRRRYRELFREEVRRTVADDAEIDDEIARLLESLADS